jgi:hypothetical protein
MSLHRIMYRLAALLELQQFVSDSVLTQPFALHIANW